MSLELEISKQLVFGQVLVRQARKFPDAEALVFRDKRYTYTQFNERVNRLANGLKDLGIEKDDKVAVLFTNCIEIVESYFAAFKIGAVVVPLNYRLSPRELSYQLDHSDSKALIFGEAFKDTVASIQPELAKVKHYICAGDRGIEGAINYEELLQNHSAEEPLVFVSDDDPAFIMYTAGTTGRPKGAVITHKNYLVGAGIGTNIEMIRPEAEPFQLTFGPHRTLIAIPICHAAGTSLLIGSVFIGGTAIITDNLAIDNLLRLMQDEKVTTTLLVPVLWIWILEHPNLKDFDLSSLRTATYGGAVMPLEVKKRLMETLPDVRFAEAFGQTEASGTCLAKHEDLLKKHGSVGRPRLDVEVRIVDEDDNDVPVGEVGEIVYRGPIVMKEYYKNPEATAEAFRGGWFHSGDLVRQDEDGYIYVVGRKKDMIISGGHNIYPEEIEDVLHTHPKILEAAVIGVPHPEWGESVKAVVVPKQGERLTEAEVIDHCRQNLASYKKPKSVEFVDQLPKNPVGKVLKTVLRERYGQATR